MKTYGGITAFFFYCIYISNAFAVAPSISPETETLIAETIKKIPLAVQTLTAGTLRVVVPAAAAVGEVAGVVAEGVIGISSGVVALATIVVVGDVAISAKGGIEARRFLDSKIREHEHKKLWVRIMNPKEISNVLADCQSGKRDCNYGYQSNGKFIPWSPYITARAFPKPNEREILHGHPLREIYKGYSMLPGFTDEFPTFESWLAKGTPNSKTVLGVGNLPLETVQIRRSIQELTLENNQEVAEVAKKLRRQGVYFEIIGDPDQVQKIIICTYGFHPLNQFASKQALERKLTVIVSPFLNIFNPYLLAAFYGNTEFDPCFSSAFDPLRQWHQNVSSVENSIVLTPKVALQLNERAPVLRHELDHAQRDEKISKQQELSVEDTRFSITKNVRFFENPNLEEMLVTINDMLSGRDALKSMNIKDNPGYVQNSDGFAVELDLLPLDSPQRANSFLWANSLVAQKKAQALLEATTEMKKAVARGGAPSFRLVGENVWADFQMPYYTAHIPIGKVEKEEKRKKVRRFLKGLEKLNQIAKAYNEWFKNIELARIDLNEPKAGEGSFGRFLQRLSPPEIPKQ